MGGDPSCRFVGEVQGEGPGELTVGPHLRAVCWATFGLFTLDGHGEPAWGERAVTG